MISSRDAIRTESHFECACEDAIHNDIEWNPERAGVSAPFHSTRLRNGALNGANLERNLDFRSVEVEREQIRQVFPAMSIPLNGDAVVRAAEAGVRR